MLSTNRQVFIYDDDSTWVDMAHVQNIDDFKKSYTHIRGYHACRTMDVNSYLQNGIKPATRDNILELGKQLFGNYSSGKELAAAFDALRGPHVWKSIGVVWFELHKQNLISGNEQYRLEGSGLIGRMAGILKLENPFVNHGTPMIFSVDIPIELIPAVYIAKIITYVYNMQPESGKCQSNLPVSVKNTILPQFIVSYEKA